MVTRNDVLSQAVDECIKELYSLAVPRIKWEDFKEQCKIYSKLYKEWKSFSSAYNLKEKNPKQWEDIKIKYESLDWENKSMEECIGPRPFEFYFLPADILKDICDNYVYAYQLDSQQELLNIIQILKNYCKEPIVDKWIEGENGDPGHKGYEHPDNLEKEIYKYLDSNFTGVEFEHAEILKDKFFEFLDMAGKFYNWNRDLNAFNMSVYLGPSPNSNKEAVINNWKKYRDKDIEINEEQIKKDYYDEDE